MEIQGRSKPFYKRPENLTGLLIAGGLLYAGLNLAPLIIVAATNTLYASFLVGVLGVLLFAVMDKDIRTTAFYAWKMVTRGITGFLINLDPIAIVETYLKKMESRLDEMLDSKNSLGGQIKKLNSVIETNLNDATKNMKLAQAAKDNMDKSTFSLKAQQLKLSNDELNKTKSKMDLMFKVLDRMYKNTNYILENTRMQVDIKKRERDAVMAGHRAMASGWKVIKGDAEQKHMFDQAMESIADTMGRQLAEMEQIMDTSSGIMNGVDLEKGIIQTDALKMLDKWEKEGQSALLGTTEKNILLSEAYDDNVIEVTGTEDKVPVRVGKSNKFDKLLK